MNQLYLVYCISGLKAKKQI